MECTAYQRWFSPYVDERLSPQEFVQLEGHLASCARCRDDLASLQRMLRSLKTMEQPATPELLPGIHERLLRVSWWRAAWQRFAAPWPASLPLHGVALATTAVLVVVVVGLPGYLKHGRVVERRVQLASGKTAPTRKDLPLAFGKAFSSEPTRTEEKTKESRWWMGDEGAKGSDENEELRESVGEQQNAVGRGDAGGVFRRGTEMPTSLAQARNKDFALAKTAEEVLDDKTSAKKMTASVCPLGPLQVRWQVANLPVAVSQVREWVHTRQGVVTTQDERHLAIQLAAADVPEFLQRFSSTSLKQERVSTQSSTEARGVSLSTPVPEFEKASPPASQPKVFDQRQMEGAESASLPVSEQDASLVPSQVTISLELVPSE